MIEYLKKYKELLKQLEINKNKIQENELLLDENYRKWSDSKNKLDKLELEISELNKAYDNLINKKMDSFFNKLQSIITIFAITILILLTMYNAFYVLLATPLLVAFCVIIYLTTFLISKCTNVFEKKFSKDKNVNSLVQTITNKEKELSEVKAICDEYSQKIIKYRKQLKQLDNEKTNNYNSINELMVNYATPIFNEQLNNIQEEQKDTPLTKTKKPDHKNI